MSENTQAQVALEEADMAEDLLNIPAEEIDVRKPMRNKDWERIEDWYVAQVNAIEIPEDLDPAILLQLNAKIAKLYTKARFDYAYLKRQYEKIKRQIKRAEKQAYMAVKDIGKNDKEREGLVNKYLEDNKVFGYPITIYDALDKIEERTFFMEAVMDDINSKAGRLITANGGLKLDLELSNG
jgi:hypothetical protein